jgi:hypothetical protein
LERPNSRPHYFLVKTTNEIEYAVHRLVSQAFREAVPELIAGGRTGHDAGAEWLLVLEDLPVGPLARVTARAGPGKTGAPPCGMVRELAPFREALRLLARVHAHFQERRCQLEGCGLRPITPDALSLQRSVPASCALLRFCKTFFDLCLDGQAIAELERIGSFLPAVLRSLGEPEAWTLVHGDLHFGNLLLDACGGVRIADWGSAAIQAPAWDLILCGEPEVNHYLAAATGHACHLGTEKEFLERLRAAVICRMYGFIQTGLASLLQAGSTWVLDALPVCVRRLLEAAGSTAFRGGQGICFRPEAPRRAARS